MFVGRRLRDYRGRAALVTGASSGIGRILSLRLAREGARLALLARRADALEAVADEIRERGGEAIVLPCDVSDLGAAEDAARSALARFGAIDLLVNNAGYGHRGPFLEWELEDMERMIRVNFLGALSVTRALAPSMVERGEGWIVFIASVAGRIAPPEESVYAASKFAMVGLAESLSVELEDSGVHVLTVCPGAIRTSFFDAEALRRLPPVAQRWMVEPDALVHAVLDALARGRRSLTYPRALAAAYVVRALAPGFLRRQVKRTTLGTRRDPPP